MSQSLTQKTRYLPDSCGMDLSLRSYTYGQPATAGFKLPTAISFHEPA